VCSGLPCQRPSEWRRGGNQQIKRRQKGRPPGAWYSVLITVHAERSEQLQSMAELQAATLTTQRPNLFIKRPAIKQAAPIQVFWPYVSNSLEML
jgi:hypothetical protein